MHILQEQIKDLTPRSIQYHFLQATGITQNMARQIERARYATLLMVHPVIAGSGKRLFEEGESLKRLKLVSAKATRTGTVILTYQPVKE